MSRPPDWKVDTGRRTAGSTQYEPVDKDGLFGDERKKLGQVQDVLKQFAPASAYHGDRNLREMGEAMMAQFTSLAKTRYEQAEAQTKLLQTSAYYDHAIEKSKPVHETDLDKVWIHAAAAAPPPLPLGRRAEGCHLNPTALTHFRCEHDRAVSLAAAATPPPLPLGRRAEGCLLNPTALAQWPLPLWHGPHNPLLCSYRSSFKPSGDRHYCTQNALPLSDQEFTV